MWPVNIVIPCVTSYYVKKVEVNSPYFMSIHAAQNNIPVGDVALILPLPHSLWCCSQKWYCRCL